MLATAINAWLKGRGNYADGLTLLKQTGAADETDLWFLELGETSLSRDQLRTMLQGLHARLVREVLVAPTNAMPHPVLKADVAEAHHKQGRDVTSDGYAQLVTTMPTELRALHDQVREWAREMNYLRYPERMEALPSDEDRLRDFLRVLDLDKKIVSAYVRLDAWRDTGRDPGPAVAPSPAQKNPVQLVKELKNIESYLSRVKSGKRTASPAKVKQWEEQKAKLSALIDAVPS